MKSKEKRRSVALLQASDLGDVLVERIEMSLESYYDELHPVVDSHEYRAARGVRRLKGWLYDSGGVVVQEFENEYDVKGSLTRSREMHDDGTVVEETFKLS